MFMCEHCGKSTGDVIEVINGYFCNDCIDEFVFKKRVNNECN